MDNLVPFMVDEDDLLNFTLDDGDHEDPKTVFKASSSSSSLESSNPSTVFNPETQSAPFAEFQEEELEWLSNKDAFPELDTYFSILDAGPELIMLNHQSPVSVLENSSSSSNNMGGNNSGSTFTSSCGSLGVPKSYPVRARSKSMRRKRATLVDLTGRCPWLDQVDVKKNRQESPLALPPLPITTNNAAAMGRRCLHCQVDKTPQWRAGPMGPKTLCNACGVRYKSGRLFPEYRPANSPTFLSALHSNSHRKVIEMRRQKHLSTVGGIAESEACGYRG